MPECCSGFVTGFNFLARRTRINEKHLGNCGGCVAPKDCPRCSGSGYIARPVDISGKSEGVAFIRMKCPACAGSGRKNSPPPSTAG